MDEKGCKVIIRDEVNCALQGLIRKDLNFLIEKTNRSVKGAYHTAAVKVGAWDGKESQVSDNGTTFLFMLEKVLPLIENLGYDLEMQDNRPAIIPINTQIDHTYLSEYGITLRPYQVHAVNLAVTEKQGIIEAATSSGKTYICAGLAKIYNKNYRSITIVPKLNLVHQTKKVFEQCNLDVGEIHGKLSAKNKEKEWIKRHIITTWQTLNKNRKHLHKFNVVLYDELHIMGDTMFNLLAKELAHAHIRIGFTGTVPKDKQKREKICCRIGGEVFYEVPPKELQDDGYISSVDIKIIPIQHEITLPDSDWSTEMTYLMTNKKRLDVITDYIQNLSPENTLILTHSQFGEKLAKRLSLDFIDRRIDPDIREEYYKKFDDSGKYELVATFDTVGTGISIDNIQRLFLIDAGKADTRIIQGIGRGLRLDGKANHLDVIDLYSELFKPNDDGDLILYNYSGKRHVIKRKTIYRKNEFPFEVINPIVIEV